ncbi:hypothetical protein J3Q64DRAFT_1710104 [Phycomyces blakesleeanus]|uniref:Uncharacterized protein n=1 Tax=Phycomyces blakesleeanus TaxID=4837 RepID=A0ABR3BGA8_PHYBL
MATKAGDGPNNDPEPVITPHLFGEHSSTFTLSHSTSKIAVENWSAPRSSTKARHRRLSGSSRHSSRSTKSVRRHIESVSKTTVPEYHPRSYAEMMRIPNVYERIVFYEKTFDLCMQANSALSAWSTRVRQQGIPIAMRQGYQPPPRSNDANDTLKTNNGLSGSISMFLRKSKPPVLTSYSQASENRQSNQFFPPSMSRRSLARYAQSRSSPQDSPNLSYSFARPPHPVSLFQRHTDMPSPGHRSRVGHAKQMPFTSMRRSIERPVEKVRNVETSDALREMCDVLPQMDECVLNDYLKKAGGDSVLGISLAVGQFKQHLVRSLPFGQG